MNNAEVEDMHEIMYDSDSDVDVSACSDIGNIDDFCDDFFEVGRRMSTSLLDDEAFEDDYHAQDNVFEQVQPLHVPRGATLRGGRTRGVHARSGRGGLHTTSQNVSLASGVAPRRPRRSAVPNDGVNWTTDDFFPVLGSFSGNPGVKVTPNVPESVSSTAELFLGLDFYQLIVDQTNIYCRQNVEKLSTHNKDLKWMDVTVVEMKKFMGLIILMGHVRKNRLRDYWSTDCLLETPIFGRTMSRNRFFQILQMLHFSNNELRPIDANRLYKVQTLIDHFIPLFQAAYKPDQNISLDEAMIPWRGKLSFRVYNPDKIHKYGILSRAVCEARTGYICNFALYHGENYTLQNTVTNLLSPYNNQGYHCYLDNYYNSVKLADTLLEKDIRICGTIRQNRGLPADFKEKSNALKKGDNTFCNNGQILLHSWCDKRVVRMISTIHSSRMVHTGKNNYLGNEIIKPESVLDYNKYMSGVDISDQFLSYYNIHRKTIKWSKKVYFHLVMSALYNSFVIFKKNNISTKKTFRIFLLNYVSHLILESNVPSFEDDTTVAPSPLRARVLQDPQDRLSGDMVKHVLIPIPATEKKNKPCRTCKVCAKHHKRSETRYMCKHCRVSLHKGECWHNYHTKLKY